MYYGKFYRWSSSGSTSKTLTRNRSTFKIWLWRHAQYLNARGSHWSTKGVIVVVKILPLSPWRLQRTSGSNVATVTVNKPNLASTERLKTPPPPRKQTYLTLTLDFWMTREWSAVTGLIWTPSGWTSHSLWNASYRWRCFHGTGWLFIMLLHICN